MASISERENGEIEADHRCHGQEAGGNGALDRGLAGADARGPGPLGGHRGYRPWDLPRRSASAGLYAQGGRPVPGQPATRGRAITLTFDQFKYGWADALDEKEAKELYDTFHVAGSGSSLMQMGNATSTRGRRRR
jgi:hypothetical protein